MSLDNTRLGRLKASWIKFVHGWPAALMRQWPLLIVVLCIVAGICLILTLHWKRGAMMIGGATALAGLLRLLLPEDKAGLLVVRGRLMDATVTGLAGVAMIVLAFFVPPL